MSLKTLTRTNRIPTAARAGWIACILLWVPLTPVAAQSQAAAPPAQAGSVSLTPLPDVNLDGMEPDVAEQLRSAREVLDKTLQTPGVSARDLAENFGLMGQIYHAYELTGAAKACYMNAVALAPGSFKWDHYLGLLAVQEGDLAGAVESFTRALRVQPNSLATLIRLGEAYLQQGDLAEARSQFLKGMAVDPSSAAAAYGLGQVALSNREYADAVGLFHKTLALLPDANAVHYPLALAYRSLGRMEDAERHLRQQGAVGVAVADPLLNELHSLTQGEIVFLLRGRGAFQAGRFQEAAQLFLQAAAAAPASARSRINAAAALAAMKDSEGAAKFLRDALELDPENATANYNLGVLLQNLGQHQEALPHLVKAVELSPRDDGAHLALARSLFGVGNSTDGMSALGDALRINKSNEDARLEFARRLVDEGRFRDAKTLLEEAHREFPGDGRTAHALARILAACPEVGLRDGAAALPLALRVFEARNSVGHARTVAMAYAEMGQCGKAAEWLASILDAVSGGEGLAPDLLDDLRAELARYRQGSPCRPPY